VDFHTEITVDTAVGGWDDIEETIRLRLCPYTTVKKIENLIKKVRTSKENASTSASCLGWGIQVAPVLRCDLCGNDEQEHFIVDRFEGDTICLGRNEEGCGNVISERAVHLGDPHRTFADDTTDKGHHGAVPLAALSESSYFRLNSVKNSECKHRFLTTSKFKKMAQIIEGGFSSTGTDSKRTRVEYKDQEIEKAMAVFANVCHCAALNTRVADIAVANFASHRNLVDVLRNVKNVYAACLILAHRQIKAVSAIDPHRIASTVGRRNSGGGGRARTRTTGRATRESIKIDRPKWVPPPPPKCSDASATKRKYSSLFFTPSGRNANKDDSPQRMRHVRSRRDSETRKKAVQPGQLKTLQEKPCTDLPQQRTPMRCESINEDSNLFGGEEDPSNIIDPPEQADFADSQAFQGDEETTNIDPEWFEEQHRHIATSTSEDKGLSCESVFSTSEQECDKGQSSSLSSTREPTACKRKRRQRMCERALTEEIRKMFGNEERLTFAQLNAQLNQPEKYLKQVLSHLCTVERKKALVYTMKPADSKELASLDMPTSEQARVAPECLRFV